MRIPGERLKFGLQVEALAWEWYRQDRAAQGIPCRLLARGFRRRCGELDLVIEEDGPLGRTLVFAEVRARCGKRVWMGGIESVGTAKRRRLSRVARVFLASYRGSAREVRWDILAWDGVRISHFPDAWHES